jgi:hypothetical protein
MSSQYEASRLSLEKAMAVEAVQPQCKRSMHMSFERNDELLEQFLAGCQGMSSSTFVDFGKVLQESDALRHWEMQVESFITSLRKHGYKVGRAICRDDGHGPCPLYPIRVDALDGNGPTPAPLPYLLWFVQHLCKHEQKAELRDRIVEIHLFGDDGEEPASVPTV